MSSVDEKQPLKEYHDDECSSSQVLISSGDVSSQPKPRWAWGGVRLAAVSFICCHSVGLVALLYNVFAYVDYQAGDYNGAKRKKRVGQRYAICAIFLGLTVLLVFVVSEVVVGVVVMNMVERLQPAMMGIAPPRIR